MEEKILTPDQVAQKLQVHPFTVLKFIKQGKLKASKLGRVYRIRGSDVDQFLDDQLTRQEERAARTQAKQHSIDQSIKISEEKISVSKEISPDSLRLGNESKENALPEEIPPSDSDEKQSSTDIPLAPDHYYILD